MDIEKIQQFCLAFPEAEAEIKWRSDLVFMVGRKMFCMVDLETIPPTVSFKVPDDEFEELSQAPGFKPAPWFGKNKWVAVTNVAVLSTPEWQKYLEQSYMLVKAKLARKVLRQLGLE